MLSPTDEIKSKLDIVDVIQEYFPLKVSGVNFRALCPFHQEKTPSFMVNRERQFYYCFGCHEGGDIFSFIQKMEGIEFPEALRILANKAGVRLPAYDPETTNLKTRILNIQDIAAEWFHNQLLNSAAGEKAMAYLKEERGLKEKTIQDWQLGYALDSWQALTSYLKSKNFTEYEILQSGLVVQKQNSKDFYDRFRGRIIFPIRDYHGNIVGFTGRAMSSHDKTSAEQAKYVNSPQTLVYNKSEVVFGLYKAKQAIKEHDAVIIVEGNMDVITSHQAGVRNAVAMSGTALTPQHVRILKRLTNNFLFCFDLDSAGLKAADKSFIFSVGQLVWGEKANVKIISLNRDLGEDPDEVIKRDPRLWLKAVESTKPAMEFFLDTHLRDLDEQNIERKKEIIFYLLKIISYLPDRVEQDFYLKKLAEKTNTEERNLREEFYRLENKDKESVSLEIKKEKKSMVDKKTLMGERLLAYMLLDADYAEYISENLALEHLPIDLSELYKSLIVYYTKKEQQGSLEDFIQSNNPDLTVILNGLLLLKDEELSGLSYNEAISEIKKYIQSFKWDFVREKLKKINKQIDETEKSLFRLAEGPEKEAQKTKLNQLMEQHIKLSSELR